MRKKLVTLLSILCLGCACGGTLAACKEENSVNLLEFPNSATEDVLLGEIYKTKESVVDENGNEYSVSVSVSDSTGNKVPVIDGEFLIDSLDGYTIVYYANVNGGQRMSLTLNVSDEDAPDIFMQGRLDYIFVNNPVAFPNIKFKDLGGLDDTSIKLYCLNDGETEIALSEENGLNTFTPTETGNYVLRAEATDSVGNVKTKDWNFEVYDESIIYAPTVDEVDGIFKEGGDTASSISYTPSISNESNVYTGSYISLQATSAVGSTLRIKDTADVAERVAALQEKGYDYVKIWVKAIAFDANMSSYSFNWLANCPTLPASIETNEWVQLRMPIDIFANYCNKPKNETWLMYVNLMQSGGLSKFCLGEIVGEENGIQLAENVLYSPAELGTVGITKAGGGNESVVSYVDVDESRNDSYKGGYISYTRKGYAGGAANTMDLLPYNALKQRIANIQALGYNTAKVWVKAVTNDVAVTDYTFMWTATCPAANATIKTNQWVQVTLPLTEFADYYTKESTSAGSTWLMNVALGDSQVLSEFCLGEIVADKLADDVLYSPAELGAEGLTRAGSSGTSTLTYVSLSDSTSVYQGAYISYVQNGTSAANTLDIVVNSNITKRLTSAMNAGYNQVKIWIKAVTNDATVSDYTFTLCAGGGAPNVKAKTNEWTQIALPMSVFNAYWTTESANVNNAWLLNVALGRSSTLREFCLGDIVAEKYTPAANVVYSPTELGTTGVATANGSGGAGKSAYCVGDLMDTNYTGGYISLKSTTTTGITTIAINKNDTLTNRLTTLAEMYTKVKVWVKVVSTGTEAVNMTWCAGTGLSSNISVPVNEWTQVELGMANFKGTYEQGVWMTYPSWANGTVTEFCLGEVVGA